MGLPDLTAITCRAICYIAALQAAGLAVFRLWFEDELTSSTATIRRLAFITALSAIAATLGYELVEPARLAGSFAGITDMSLHAILLGSSNGTAFAIRLLGLLILAFGAMASTRFGSAMALAGGTLVVASFLFTGHTTTHKPHWLLAVLLLVHLGVVAVWFGTLLPFYIVAKREPIENNTKIVDGFSAVAVWLVPFIFFAGVAMAAVILPDFASLTSAYGIMLLVKLSGFTVLMGFAALNKWRLAPLIRTGQAHALTTFQHSVLTEWILIAAVIASTAVMTATLSPEP